MLVKATSLPIVCRGHYHTPRSRNYTAKPLNPQRVRVLLAAQEASKVDLALHLGVSRQRVSHLLEGRRINEQTAHKMAKFFGVGVDYLIDSES
jgi:plasmid maintenance system antidote protein VapI